MPQTPEEMGTNVPEGVEQEVSQFETGFDEKMKEYLSSEKDPEAYASLVNYAAASLAQTANPTAILNSIKKLFLRAVPIPDHASTIDAIHLYCTTEPELITFLIYTNSLALAAKASVDEIAKAKEAGFQAGQTLSLLQQL